MHATLIFLGVDFFFHSANFGRFRYFRCIRPGIPNERRIDPISCVIKYVSLVCTSILAFSRVKPMNIDHLGIKYVGIGLLEMSALDLNNHKIALIITYSLS